MRVRSSVATSVGILFLAGSCVSTPRLKPDVKGPGRLALADASELDAPPFPDAVTLPKLTGSPSTGTSPVTRPPYRLGPLDEVIVVVWGRPDLGSQVPVGQNGALRASTVREDGSLVLPFLGPIAAEGKTTQEIGELVQSAYAKLIERPQVEVELHTCGSKKVEVSGAVESPGIYPLCVDRLTVGEILTAAGGVQPTADLARGLLTRDGTAFRLDFREGERVRTGATDVLLKAGDTVHFPSVEERVVYVFGEVTRQGVFTIPRQGMTLLAALGGTLGFKTDKAKTRGIFLVRRVGSDFVAYKLDLRQLLDGPDIQLAAGDRVFVPMTGLEKWDIWWEKAFPFLNFRTTVVAPF